MSAEVIDGLVGLFFAFLFGIAWGIAWCKLTGIHTYQPEPEEESPRLRPDTWSVGGPDPGEMVECDMCGTRQPYTGPA